MFSSYCLVVFSWAENLPNFVSHLWILVNHPVFHGMSQPGESSHCSAVFQGIRFINCLLLVCFLSAHHTSIVNFLSLPINLVTKLKHTSDKSSKNEDANRTPKVKPLHQGQAKQSLGEPGIDENIGKHNELSHPISSS